MSEIKLAKVNKRSAWRAPLALVGLFLVVMLVMSFVYRVQKIEVVNASEYTDEQIIQASGISKGDNLFFVDRFKSASLIFSDLKYLDSVSIQRSLPGKIVIQAEGSAPAVYLNLDGTFWLMARNGNVLDSVNQLEAETYPEVKGFRSVTASKGEMLLAADTDIQRLENLSALVYALQGEQILGDVQWMDFSAVENIAFRYQDRITVNMGSPENLPMKLGSFIKAIGLLSPDDTGALSYAEGTVWNYAPD